MADNNQKGGGGQQAAPGITVVSKIDPSNMDSRALSGTFLLAAFVAVGAFVLNKVRGPVQSKLFGMADAGAAPAITTDAAKGVIIKALEGKEVPLLNLSSGRHIIKNIVPSLTQSRDPKDLDLSRQVLVNALATFDAAAKEPPQS